jgi:CheY-like chemotaxis protein
MNRPEHLLPPDANQVVILLVVDAPLIRNVARIVLEREGYFILTAADGEEALYLSRTFPVRIHLLLSDVKMARMDGWQLRERVMEERPGTKVLLMSSQVEMAREQAFLRKPFGPNVLRERVRQTLLTSRKTLQLGRKRERQSAA